jgi:DNA-entry nuclease
MKKHPYVILLFAVSVSLAVGYYFGSRSVSTDSVSSNQHYYAQAPKPTSTLKPTSAPKRQTYVLNIRTKKFHYPDCRSVKKMNDSNKKEVTWSRTEIVNKGYSPCGNCNP